MECVMCKSKTFYTASEVGSRGHFDLLPGTGFFSHAHFTQRICTECGFVHWFVDGDNLEKLSQSDYYRRETLE